MTTKCMYGTEEEKCNIEMKIFALNFYGIFERDEN
jgi:hypothetical protein